MATLKVTLVRSQIGCTKTQRATLKGLGLTRRLKSVEVEDNPSMRGMIKKIIHLLEVEPGAQD